MSQSFKQSTHFLCVQADIATVLTSCGDDGQAYLHCPASNALTGEASASLNAACHGGALHSDLHAPFARDSVDLS